MLAHLRGCRSGVTQLVVSARGTYVVLAAWHEIALDTDVVVCKFAHLRIVNAKDFSLFVAVEAELGMKCMIHNMIVCGQVNSQIKK